MYKFNQNDKKWGDVIYSSKIPHTETIKSSGCGICSAAMIISNLTDTYIEPPKIAEYSVKNGFRVDGVGTAFALYPAIATKYNLSCVQTGDISKAIECIKKGGMVVCSTSGGENKLFSSGGHLFVMTGVSGDEVEFYDVGIYSGKYNTIYRKARCKVKNDFVYVNKNEAKKHITTYFMFERKGNMNIYSYDDTVEKLIKFGITDISNMEYWEKVLSGREPLDKDNVRTIFDRLLEKIK